MENKLLTLEELNAKQWECVNSEYEFVKFIYVLRVPKFPYVIIFKKNGVENMTTLDAYFKMYDEDKIPFLREVKPKPNQELTFTFIVWEKNKNIPRSIIQYDDFDAFKKSVNSIKNEEDY